MLKKISLVACLSGSLALAACGISVSELTGQVAAIESQVQADANLICGFVPTIATIASFIPGGAAVVPEAASIAVSICAAIASAPPITVQSARSRSVANRTAVNVATVTVPGVGPVAISGTFTR